MKEFSAKDFRAELLNVMPGYKWAVERTNNNNYLQAMGTISSGFNRTSTLFVKRTVVKSSVEYTAKIDTNFAWKNYTSMSCAALPSFSGHSLKFALRELQNYHMSKAYEHSKMVSTLQSARCPKEIKS